MERVDGREVEKKIQGEEDKGEIRKREVKRIEEKVEKTKQRGVVRREKKEEVVKNSK